MHKSSLSRDFTNECRGQTHSSVTLVTRGKSHQKELGIDTRISDQGFRHQDEKTALIAHVSTDSVTTTEKNVPSNNLISQHRAEEIHLSVAPKSQRASVDHELQIIQFDRARHKALDQTHQSAHHELASIQQLAVAC